MDNKKLILGTACLLFLSLFCLGSISALSGEVIKSASELSYPPFSVVDDQGQADGFSVELLRAALKAENLDVSFYVAPWDQIKQELAEGKIQVLPVVGKTPERELVYDFTEPYLTFYGAIFVRTGDTRIKNVNDLIDKEILVMKGDNAEEYVIRSNISKNIITTSTYEEAFQLLSEGKYDAIIAQQVMGSQLIRQLGIKNVAAVNYRLTEFRQDFTFAVKKGDSDLLNTLNSGLKIVLKDGTFDRLYTKWFISLENNIFKYSFFTLIIIIIIIITLIIFYLKNKNRKNEVK